MSKVGPIKRGCTYRPAQATLSWADLHTLAAAPAARAAAPAAPAGVTLPPVQTDLRAVGRYLDTQQADDILVQEWGGGYHVGFTPPRADDAAPGGATRRLLITLTDAELHPR